MIATGLDGFLQYHRRLDPLGLHFDGTTSKPREEGGMSRIPSHLLLPPPLLLVEQDMQVFEAGCKSTD